MPAVFCALCGASAYSYPIADPYTTVNSVLDGGKAGLDKSHFVNLKLEYDLGSVSFSNIAAYRKTDNFVEADFDFTEVDAFNIKQVSSQSTFTNEFTLATKLDGIFNATAGFSYLHDNSQFKLWLGPAAALPSSVAPLFDNPVTTSSVGVFAEGTLEPVQNLKFIAGGRYTHDSRQFLGQSISFDSFTPRFVLSYDFGNLNVYASYNKGFKAGGYSLPAFPPADIVKPEQLESYEVGAKFVSADRKLRFNLAAFKFNYKNVVVLVLNQANGTGRLVNAAAATAKGFELDFDYRPVEALQLFGAVSHLDSRFTDYKNAQVQMPTYDALGKPTGFTVGFMDLTGSPLARAPRWTAYTGATLSGNIGSWKGELTGMVRYSSGFDFAVGGAGPLHADHQDGYTTVKLSGKIGPADGPYDIGFFVDNLTNAKYYNFKFSTAPFGAMGNIARPRTYGVRLGVNF